MARTRTPYGQRVTISPREAADLLGVSETLVREQITQGVLPASRLGKRWLIPRTAIDALGRGEQQGASEGRRLKAL